MDFNYLHFVSFFSFSSLNIGGKVKRKDKTCFKEIACLSARSSSTLLSIRFVNRYTFIYFSIGFQTVLERLIDEDSLKSKSVNIQLSVLSHEYVPDCTHKSKWQQHILQMHTHTHTYTCRAIEKRTYIRNPQTH